MDEQQQVIHTVHQTGRRQTMASALATTTEQQQQRKGRTKVPVEALAHIAHAKHELIESAVLAIPGIPIPIKTPPLLLALEIASPKHDIGVLSSRACMMYCQEGALAVYTIAGGDEHAFVTSLRTLAADISDAEQQAIAHCQELAAPPRSITKPGAATPVIIDLELRLVHANLLHLFHVAVGAGCFAADPEDSPAQARELARLADIDVATIPQRALDELPPYVRSHHDDAVASALEMMRIEVGDTAPHTGESPYAIAAQLLAQWNTDDEMVRRAEERDVRLREATADCPLPIAAPPTDCRDDTTSGCYVYYKTYAHLYRDILFRRLEDVVVAEKK
jgi:hypothetical protein